MACINGIHRAFGFRFTVDMAAKENWKRFRVFARCFISLLVIHSQSELMQQMLLCATCLQPETLARNHGHVGKLSPNPGGLSYTRMVFFCGAIIGPLPSAFLTFEISTQLLLGACLSFAGLVTCFFLVSMIYGLVSGFFLISFLQGLIQGAMLPITYSILSKWRPIHLLTGSIVLAATYIGDMFGAIIAIYPPSSIRMHVIVGQGCSILLAFLFVTTEDNEYLYVDEEHLLPTDRTFTGEVISPQQLRKNQQGCDTPRVKIPWRKMFSSKPVLILIYCNFVYYMIYFSFTTIVSRLGYDLKDVFGIPPQLYMLITSCISVWLARCLNTQPLMTMTHLRRIFVSAGMFLEAFCIVCASLVPTKEIALIFLTVGVGFSGWTASSLLLNPLELSPNYSTIVGGICSASAYIGALVGQLSLVTGAPDYVYNVLLMRCLLEVLTLLLLIGTISYTLFGTSDCESWSVIQNQIGKQMVLIKLPGVSQEGKPYVTVTYQMEYGWFDSGGF